MTPVQALREFAERSGLIPILAGFVIFMVVGLIFYALAMAEAARAERREMERRRLRHTDLTALNTQRHLRLLNGDSDRNREVLGARMRHKDRTEGTP